MRQPTFVWGSGILHSQPTRLWSNQPPGHRRCLCCPLPGRCRRFRGPCCRTYWYWWCLRVWAMSPLFCALPVQLLDLGGSRHKGEGLATPLECLPTHSFEEGPGVPAGAEGWRLWASHSYAVAPCISLYGKTWKVLSRLEPQLDLRDPHAAPGKHKYALQ